MGLFDKLGNFLGGKKRDINILIIGLDNSGKTTILNFLKPAEMKSNSISATVGFTVEKFQYKSLTLNTFDMSGQSRYRNLWEHYYKEADCIVFVIDCSDKMRFVVAKEEIENMLNHAEIRNKKIPILIFANKTDIRSSASLSEVRNEIDIEQIHDKNCRIFSSNGLNGEGISEAFDWLIEELKSKE